MRDQLLMAGTVMVWATASIAEPVLNRPLGGSGDPIFSERIAAENGDIYHCKPNANGQSAAQECTPEALTNAGVFGAGTAGGIALASAKAGGMAALGAIASDALDGATTTTATVPFKR